MKSLIRLILTLLLLVAPLAEATIYRWTDAQGVIHFSDSPPPKHGAKQVVPRTTNVLSLGGPRKPSLSRGPNKKAVETFTKEQHPVEGLGPQAIAQSDVRKSGCLDARRRLNYMRVTRFAYENDAKGVPRLLSDEERRIAERALGGEVEFWCRARQ